MQLHHLRLFILFFVLWLMLSGMFESLLIGLGVASCMFVLGVALRMDVVDHQGRPIRVHFRRLVWYWFWLLKEIAKASIDVTLTILRPSLPISPTVIRVKTTQPSQLGQVIYANSITLTPGTISIDLSGDEIEVHALTRETAMALAEGDMDRRITALDTKN